MKDNKLRIKLFTHFILLNFCVITTYPLLWMVFGSLKSRSEFYSNLWWWPKQWQILNYMEAWKTAQLAVTFKNSIFVTGTTIIMVVFVSYLAAYVLARFDFKGNGLIMSVFLATLMLPAQVTIIPLFQLAMSLNIYNTHWGIILPYVTGSMPLSILILIAFIRSIPRELDESAEIDGCNKLNILWRIIYPLSKPALATIIILVFINVWNEFFLGLVMIQDPSLRTIPIGMTHFNSLFGAVQVSHLFAAMSIVMLPSIFIFIIFQKYFISGLTQGAIKT